MSGGQHVLRAGAGEQSGDADAADGAAGDGRRPNRLGLCTCKIVGVDGLAVEVEGLDAIDGTPVLDLKPAMREFLPRGDLAQPAWASDLMKDYW